MPAATPPDADDAVLAADERVILALADELLDPHGLSAVSRVQAQGFMNANQPADLVPTVGFYQLV